MKKCNAAETDGGRSITGVLHQVRLSSTDPSLGLILSPEPVVSVRADGMRSKKLQRHATTFRCSGAGLGEHVGDFSGADVGTRRWRRLQP
jgi:hypothetical protein